MQLPRRGGGHGEFLLEPGPGRRGSYHLRRGVRSVRPAAQPPAVAHRSGSLPLVEGDTRTLKRGKPWVNYRKTIGYMGNALDSIGGSLNGKTENFLLPGLITGGRT